MNKPQEPTPSEPLDADETRALEVLKAVAPGGQSGTTLVSMGVCVKVLGQLGKRDLVMSVTLTPNSLTYWYITDKGRCALAAR